MGLGAARSAARDMACLSNLRQIGIGNYAYAQENKDTLPLSFVDNLTGVADKTDWAVQISAFLSGDPTSNYGEGGQDLPSPALQCPSAAIDGGRLHYGANLMFFPFRINNAFAGGMKPYTLSRMQRTSEVLWIADGEQVDNTSEGQFIGDSYAALDKLDNFGANDIGDFYSSAATDNDRAIEPGENRDGVIPAGTGDLRWRHGSGGKENGSDGGAVNVLFGDGHAASTARGDLLKRSVRADK